MKYVKYGFLFLMLLMINNFLFYKFYQDNNPIPVLPSSKSYLTLNYTSLIDSSVLIKGIVPGGEAFGTGIWLKDGYIVTAYHVVGNMTQGIIVSRLDINTAIHATLYASDPVLDIAIIKITPEDESKIADFKPVYLQWAKNNEQSVGETLYVLGNPLDVQNTITEGILSANDKIFQQINPFVEYIQTDASLNEGNSGGAIVNSNGRIVGMSDFILGGDRSAGLNFGVSSDDIVNCINQLMISQKPVDHAYIGLIFTFVNNKILIMADPQGPAASAIPEVDEFVSLNGKTFNSIQEWVDYQKTLKVGDSVSVVVSRDNKNVTLNITSVAAPNFMARQQ